MDTLKRIIGMFFVLMAVALAVHTVVEPLYHTSGKGSRIARFGTFWTR